MNNSIASTNLLKWILLGILVYMNIGSTLQLINIVINLVLSFTSSPIWTYELSDIFFILIKVILLAGLFSFLIKNLGYIHDNIPINKYVIFNLMLLPFFLLVNAGLSILSKVYLQRNIPIEAFGKYAVFSSILGIINSVVNMILLLIFGIILLMQKPLTINEGKVE